MNQPKVTARKDIYQGKIFDVHIAEISEGGIEYSREIVSHKGSVVIVPVFADGTVAFVRQYRHAAGKYLLEIPAGTLEKYESPEIGAQRELEEEIGVTSDSIEKLTEFYVSPGFLTEKMFCFLATNLQPSAQHLDEDEILTIERYSFAEAFEKITAGEIEDAKTMTCLFLASAKLGLYDKNQHSA